MCLHGSTDPVTAALHIVLGDRLDVDVVAIHSEERLERFAMTMLSYGYFGDLMKHSERYLVLIIGFGRKQSIFEVAMDGKAAV